MDLDLFVNRHAAQWRRLDQLTARRRLTGAEADEFVELYQQVATQLALVQSRAPDPITTGRLSQLLSRARAALVGGARRSGWSGFVHGVSVDFPVAVYRSWRWWVSVAIASLGTALAMMAYLRLHPDRAAHVIGQATVKQLADSDFKNYYSAHPARSFAAQVWTNNALVAALALFLGVTLVGTLYVLVQNVLNLGLVGGIMLAAGKAGLFWGLILPHGMLELTAVFVAGGVGLRTGWAWVAPGPLPRGDSLAAAGRVAGVVTLGLAGVLAVSGAIEAFVTPSGLPTWARIGIGALAEAAFLSYIVLLGRRGEQLGADGDLAADEREAVVPVS